MYCLTTPYGSLIIDMSDKEKKFSCNFGTRLSIGDIKKVGKTDKTDKEVISDEKKSSHIIKNVYRGQRRRRHT